MGDLNERVLTRIRQLDLHGGAQERMEVRHLSALHRWHLQCTPARKLIRVCIIPLQAVFMEVPAHEEVEEQGDAVEVAPLTVVVEAIAAAAAAAAPGVIKGHCILADVGSEWACVHADSTTCSARRRAGAEGGTPPILHCIAGICSARLPGN